MKGWIGLAVLVAVNIAILAFAAMRGWWGIFWIPAVMFSLIAGIFAHQWAFDKLAWYRKFLIWIAPYVVRLVALVILVGLPLLMIRSCASGGCGTQEAKYFGCD